MQFRYFLIFIILCSHNSLSQIDNQESAQKLHSKTLIHIEKALNYLEKSQQKENDSIFRFKGEWGSQMSMNFWFPLMGGENSEYDSNCFSVATVHNILANIYLQYPEYQNIPPMLDLAFDRIMSYESDGTFNFWNLLPPTKPHKWFEKEAEEFTRRPNNYPLPLRFIQKAANVADDADDTAAGLLAIYLRNKINDTPIPDSLANIHEIFDLYTDTNRNNRMWYNLWQRQGPESGAFLTWLGEEHEFSKGWNPVQEFFHLATFYLPISKMYPKPYEPYIPYGSNDIDPVINANVLRVLSIYGNQKSIATKDAISFIKDELKNKNYNYSATYYSNRYHIPYYVSKAYKNGVYDLEESCELIQTYVLDNYEENGHWISRDLINDSDSLQSTIFAVNSLLNINGIQTQESQEAILAGLDFIFSKSIADYNQIYWKGGVFFSGGTVVRHVLHWKSDAVTTAFVLEALINLRTQLERKYPELSRDS
ncbi:hypothetical protein MATR_33190 [Marivirga tractuosa]|uniref:Uncharacterized protein n=1 Tax=Marivirga tractuosa (strain ATCC 23168 / DSM 4126 / NBRC 15989 / NCIMB 1408 / VKM B-1430 / H-43) TaxID=643867 RepID=E4TSB7_MARTH|nr:hypothetical protein [Marivirga tractuosa]ADR22834.1 hypothetical protein Ftrac_2857 [Marivirga tractuosa DSM 4126]BDD16494.1 hypothetical protein MATR_33190 [Marivirga tractuosa]